MSEPTPARPVPAADDRERLAALITDHLGGAWPAQLRATAGGGGWTYADHLARFLVDAGVLEAWEDAE